MVRSEGRTIRLYRARWNRVRGATSAVLLESRSAPRYVILLRWRWLWSLVGTPVEVVLLRSLGFADGACEVVHALYEARRADSVKGHALERLTPPAGVPERCGLERSGFGTPSGAGGGGGWNLVGTAPGRRLILRRRSISSRHASSTSTLSSRASTRSRSSVSETLVLLGTTAHTRRDHTTTSCQRRCRRPTPSRCPPRTSTASRARCRPLEQAALDTPMCHRGGDSGGCTAGSPRCSPDSGSP